MNADKHSLASSAQIAKRIAHERFTNTDKLEKASAGKRQRLVIS